MVQQELTQLRKLITEHFNLDELRGLFSDLGYDYEEVNGLRTSPVDYLINDLLWRYHLPKLRTVIIQQRPSIWDIFVKDIAKSRKEQIESQPDSKNFIHEKTGLEMVFIPAGEFLYGAEKQPLYLPSYHMAQTPVTNTQYFRFVQDIGHKLPKHWQHKGYPKELSNHPVVNVSWRDAAAFAQWAGLQLPTEQQWEKAARGNDGREHPWGTEWFPYCNTCNAEFGSTTPVNHYAPLGDSPYGCMDMLGNVWEWTSSHLDDDNKGIYKMCGGSWRHNHVFARIARREWHFPHFSYNALGFRLVFLDASNH